MVLPYMGFTGAFRWIGYGFFSPSALNRVYNFKRISPGRILDRVCLAIRNQRCLSVFILVNNASRKLSFHLRFTAVNAKFWDFFHHFQVMYYFISCDWCLRFNAWNIRSDIVTVGL